MAKRSFTLIEALVAITVMVIASGAILSSFLSSSQLQSFSENFTIGINTCQKELERIRFRYEKTTDSTTKLTFSQLTTSSTQGGINGLTFFDNDPNFRGVIVAQDPFSYFPTLKGKIALLTARVAFRAGNRIVGGTNNQLNPPASNTPCQMIIVISNRD